MTNDPAAARRRRETRLGLVVLVLLLAPFAALTVYGGRQVTVTAATSPDGRFVAEVRQPRHVFLDRNFTVVLTGPGGTPRVVFRSQDQDPTIKTESILWAADSAAFALVGDEYYVLPG